MREGKRKDNNIIQLAINYLQEGPFLIELSAL